MDESTRRVLGQFPGAVLLGTATAEDLERIEAGALRRYGAGARPPKRPAADSRLLDAWGDYLAPVFANRGRSVHFTGTYSDEYGYNHGLMLIRNVQRDLLRFRSELSKSGLSTNPGCAGVEYHPSGRKILHLHAIFGGNWSDADMRLAQAIWSHSRGWAATKPVQDYEDCVEYAAKHLLKQQDADAFTCWFDTPYVRSRHDRRCRDGL